MTTAVLIVKYYGYENTCLAEWLPMKMECEWHDQCWDNRPQLCYVTNMWLDCNVHGVVGQPGMAETGLV